MSVHTYYEFNEIMKPVVAKYQMAKSHWPQYLPNGYSRRGQWHTYRLWRVRVQQAGSSFEFVLLTRPILGGAAQGVGLKKMRGLGWNWVQPVAAQGEKFQPREKLGQVVPPPILKFLHRGPHIWLKF